MSPPTRDDLDRLSHDLRVLRVLAGEVLATADRITARLEQGLESPLQTGAATPLSTGVQN